MRSLFVPIPFLVAATLAFAACSTQTPGGAPCYPGDYIYCPCDDGVHGPGDADIGYAQCPTDGGDYGTCNCTGIHPAELDAAALVCNPDAGPLPLLCPCTTNEECGSDLCFPFNAKGPHCTVQCTEQTASTVCPPAAGGCSMMGVCMAP